jgi:hypothetical protein
MIKRLQVLTFASLVILASPLGAAAQERLCDGQFEDCRAPLIDLIRNEQIGIDVAFWFMEDARYVTELINRHNAGVPVRILVDQRANATKRLNQTMLNSLRDGGIPMREKYVADILHFKMMLFQGQNILEFSKANYGPDEFVPITPNVNFSDEAVFFTNDDRLTNSFRRRFEDLWIDTLQYRNFGNITGPLVRQYPMYPIDPSMNFPPTEDFSYRSVSRYDAESKGIDAIVFRVTDHRQADGMIRAVGRGVPVRLISEPTEYRNPTRLWDSKHIDRMWIAGVQIKMRQHEGLTHEAAVVMRGLGEVIFGSSNWTTASAGYQDEHNFFYSPTLGKPWFFQWFADQFDRKWLDSTNFVPFTPLPPDVPTYASPANFATGVPTSGPTSSLTLTWEGGTWAHLYDIYFGTTSTPPLLMSNQELGSPVAGTAETFTVSNLQPGTTYFWRIVGKTWAQLGRSGPTWSFTTAGTPPGGSPAYGGTPAPIPGTFEAENFDEGGQSVAYFDTTPGNAGGAYRSTDVDIEPTTDTGGGYDVMKTKPGEWLKYTVNVTASGTYPLDIRVANIGAGATFHVEVDGVDKTGPIAVPDTGGWQTWQTMTTAGIPFTAGQRVIRVVFDTEGSSSGVGNYNWFRVVAAPPPPPPPPTGPFGGTPVALPGILQAENFDVGGQGVAYSDTTASNSGNAYRPAEGVDIGPTNDPASGGFYVGWTREGEWLNYTVNVTATRNYTVGVRVANIGSGAKFRIEVDGVDLTGPVPVPNTTGWDTWQTVSLAGIPLTQGQHVLRLVMVTRNAENSGVGNYGYLSFQ